MRGKLLIICFLLLAASVSLRAQDFPASPLDGPVVKSDSLSVPPKPLFIPAYSGFTGIAMPSFLSPEPLPFETKEQRAARLNALIYGSVMTATGKSLLWDRPAFFTKKEKYIYRALGLFLSNPYSVPDGCIPLMNSTFPFIFALVPGPAPYRSEYSPERFPQCIRTEYDFATGTYKQVPVGWAEYQKKLSSASFHGSFDNTPVPKAVLSPGDLIMQTM